MPVFISEVPSKPQPSPCERTIEAARERPMVSTIACVRASKVDRERARFVGHRVRVLGVLRGNHLDDPEEPSYVIPIAEGFRGECRETMVTVEGDVVENADIPVIEYVNVSDGPGLVGLANAHIVRLVDD